MIHLDTNFLIQALVPSSEAEAKLQTWKKDGEALAISSIAWCEFLCGPLTQNDKTLAQMLFPAPEPFLPSDAHKAAELFQCDWPSFTQSRRLPDRCSGAALQCSYGYSRRFGLYTVPNPWTDPGVKVSTTFKIKCQQHSLPKTF
jgi:predicted nucleic acid-binding protein